MVGETLANNTMYKRFLANNTPMTEYLHILLVSGNGSGNSKSR